MHDSKVIRMLQGMPHKEVKEFWKYMKKMYDSNDFIYRLAEYLNKYYPKLTSHKLKDQVIFHKFFKGEKFNRIRLQNKFSLLATALKKFIWWRGYDHSPIEVSMFLLKQYKKHGIDNQFEGQLRTINRNIEKYAKDSHWYWLYKMQAADEHYYYMGSEDIADNSIQIFEAISNLDDFHCATKLKYASELFNKANVMKEQRIKVQFLSEIISRNYKDNDAFFSYCYKVALQMIRDRDDEKYYILKDILFNKHSLLSKDDQHILTTYLLNHTAYSIRNGRKNFTNESFSLFKNAIDKEMFISGNKFNHHHVVNIIDVACQLKEFEWATIFVLSNKKRLLKSLQSSYTSYCLAFIEFSKGNPEACYNLLKQTQSGDPFFALRVYWLDIVSRYEKNKNDEFLILLIQKVKKFVKKETKFTDNYKRNAILSLKIVSSLINPSPNEKKLKKLFSEASGFYYQKWIEKILKVEGAE